MDLVEMVRRWGHGENLDDVEEPQEVYPSRHLSGRVADADAIAARDLGGAPTTGCKDVAAAVAAARARRGR